MERGFMLAAAILLVGIIAIGGVTAFVTLSAPPQTQNIVETARNAGSFNTLLTAVEEAGLTETLETGGPFTVFAPTDEAFSKLPDGTLEAVLSDKELLTSILTYHVVSGEVDSSQVAGASSVRTLQGSTLPVDTSNGVMVGNANVVAVDIQASNGIIHVIDTVLIPS